MLKKIIFISCLLAGVFFILSPALADEEPAGTTANNESLPLTVNAENEVLEDEIVAPEELGVEEPNILPSNPFYFLKNWQRTLRETFTFDKVKKAELKLKHASEQLLETKKMSDLGKTKDETIEKATEKYQETMEKLKEATLKIKEKAGENPEVGKFLEKLTKQQVLHDRILEKLEEQVPKKAMKKIQEMREKHLENFGQVMEKLEERTRIKERIENGLNEIKGSDFKDFRILEFLGRLTEKAPEEIKNKITELKETKLENFSEKLEQMEPQLREKLQDYVEKIKGIAENKTEILEKLKQKIEGNPELQQKVEQIKERINLMDEFGEKKERVCATRWQPVCGQDGKTYGNKCFAEIAGTNVAYQGKCEPEQNQWQEETQELKRKAGETANEIKDVLREKTERIKNLLEK